MAKARAVRSGKLAKKLKLLRTETAAAVRPAVAEAAQMVVDYMIYLAPEDEGDLKRSIRWQFYEKGIRKGQIVNETRAIIMAGDANAKHAWFVEFGKGNGPAQPYFYPAYRVKKKRAVAIIGKGVRHALRTVARS